MKIFGKSKAKTSPSKGRDAVAPELDQPGFYKCYYLGSVEVDVPTREASERAFATILYVQNQMIHSFLLMVVSPPHFTCYGPSQATPMRPLPPAFVLKTIRDVMRKD